MILSFPVFLEFLKTGLVTRFPTWILSVGLSVVATLSVVCGIILDTLATSRREAMHLKYLSYPALTLSDPVILQNADVMPAKAGIQAFK